MIELGVPDLVDVSATRLRDMVTGTSADGLLVLPPDLAPPSVLATLLQRDGKPGFVVVDMADVDRFAPIDTSRPPNSDGGSDSRSDGYVVSGLDRGDDLADWSPNEALPEILTRGRTPLTLSEGIHWALQVPDVLQRNRCFMTIGSRLVTDTGRLDARTPALWISNGTGRDGAARRNAAKVGWCWAGNRHTWLGFASAAERAPLTSAGSRSVRTATRR